MAAGADLKSGGAREPNEATPLLSGRKGFPAQFVGTWRCKDHDFYAGATIEIGDHHWCPLRPKAAVHKGATFTWNACDGWYELMENRLSHDTQTFKLREGPDGMLEVSIDERVWHLVSQTDPGAPVDKEFNDLVSTWAVSDVVKETVAATRVPPVFLFISFALLVLCFFMLIFVEEWHVLTSLYVVVQCVLTIGFGDFQVTHDVTKLSLSFLMICSLVLVAFVANRVCDAVVSRHFASAADRMNEFQSGLLNQVNELRRDSKKRTESPRRTSTGTSTSTAVPSRSRCAKLLVGIFPALFCLGFGTVFYATYEACTCSYGRSRKPECNMESYQTCVDTGGYVKTWVDAFYMAVMALTTVGIGDFSPRSEFGRGMAIIWMIVGVASTGYMIRELSEFLFEQKGGKLMEADILSINREAFEIIDFDGDGQLSKTEWRLFILLKHNLVHQQVLADIDMAFEELAEGRNTIDFSDIQKHQDESFYKGKNSTPRDKIAPAASGQNKSPLSPDSDIV